ncbi:MAG: rod-binding protein [bacterium]|jgi:flagellar protein FlgJ
MIASIAGPGQPLNARTESNQEKPLKEACEDFAALFWETVLRQMRRSVPQEGLFSGGTGEEVFQGLLDQEYATQIARSEGNLAHMLFQQLRTRKINSN